MLKCCLAASVTAAQIVGVVLDVAEGGLEGEGAERAASGQSYDPAVVAFAHLLDERRRGGGEDDLGGDARRDGDLEDERSSVGVTPTPPGPGRAACRAWPTRGSGRRRAAGATRIVR